MPVYNGAAYLRESVASAVAQVGADIELIVVDDGSTDESADIIAEFGDRIRCLRQENAGTAVARNTALRSSAREWVAFLDQDDRWKPNKIAEQLRIATETGADVVYTNAEVFGEVERIGQLRSNPATMPAGDVFEHLLVDNFVTMSSVMVRRELLVKFGGFAIDCPGVDDWDMWLRLSADGAKFAAMPEPLTEYRWHSDAQSRKYGTMRNSRLRVVRSALGSDRGSSLPWVKRARSIAAAHSTSAWVAAGESRWQAAVWYLQSLTKWPFAPGVWKSLAKVCVGLPG